MNKKEIRAKFRNDCIKRDGGCKMCHKVTDLEVHHIMNRNLMPYGGYVKENGITLCATHHKYVEDNSIIQELYDMIGSSYDKAILACKLQ